MENRSIENKNNRRRSPFLSKQEIVIIGLLGIIGLISGGILSISQLALMTEEMKQEILSALGSETILIVVAAVQVFFLTIITSIIGIKISKKVGLRLLAN
ncbi:MAG: hypothetical protein K8R73_14110 [Clostridiales bacterium]|nr:hypothetical protein [Clostridiales bacterium]